MCWSSEAHPLRHCLNQIQVPLKDQVPHLHLALSLTAKELHSHV